MSGYLAFLILPYAIVGAWSYRTRGGGDWPANLPRIVDLGIWGALLALPLWFIGVPWYMALIGVAGVMLATSYGHGDFIDMGSGTGDPKEFLARIVTAIFGHPDSFWRDAFGMALSGMTYTLIPAVIASYFAGPLWLAWLLPIGALKGASYVLGRRLAIPQFDLGGTVLGEIFTGFSMVGATGLLLLWWSMAI